jgi:hypothetical protein
MDEIVRRLLRAHRAKCDDPMCPFGKYGRDYVVTPSLLPACGGRGGWEHRNHFGHLGLVGELIGHLALPEVRLQGGLGRRATPVGRPRAGVRAGCGRGGRSRSR